MNFNSVKIQSQETQFFFLIQTDYNQPGLEPVQHYQQLRIQQKGLDDVIGKLRRTGSEQP